MVTLLPPSHPGHWAARVGHLQGTLSAVQGMLQHGDDPQVILAVLQRAEAVQHEQDRAFSAYLDQTLQEIPPGCPVRGGAAACQL